MTPQDLIAAFETLAEAPEGVTRLRELVLQLAVRGKLVPQEPGDEPASGLLGRIAAEKVRLRRAGRLSKSEELPVPIAEVPFEVPPTWAWTRFGTITDARLGKMLDKAKNSGPLRPYLRNANLQWFRFVLDDIKELRLEEEELDECSVEVDDLVICEGGEPGRAAVCNESVTGMVYQKALHRARPYCGISPWYLAYLLRSDTWGGRLAELFTGATIKHLTGKSLAAYAVPLPPLAEQHRIVARVDELMGLLDRLEAARKAREATRTALRDSTLAALRDADTSEEVEVAWGRVAEQMDDLFTDPADVDPLRQTVLQLAVRGRLVPQNPDDEPASVLLERIATEKARLVKEGKIRDTEQLAPVSQDEVRFTVSHHWRWTRFQNVTDIGAGVTKGRKLVGLKAASYPYLRVANVQAGHLDLGVVKEIDVPVNEFDRYALEPGDVLLTEGGDWDKLGRSAIWSGEIPCCLHQNHVFRARPILQEGLGSRWLSMFTNSPDGRAYFQSCAKQTTNLASINKTQLRNCPVPAPPSAEQKRIVARVDELMSLLDRLAKRLADKMTAHDAFAAAAVHHLEV